MPPTPGLMLSASRIIDRDQTSEEQYNKCYDEQLVPALLNIKTHMAPTAALRYQSLNESSEWPYRAFYIVPDSVILHGPVITKLMAGLIRENVILGGRPCTDFINFDFRLYRRLKVYANDEIESEPDAELHCLRYQPQTLVCDVLDGAFGDAGLSIRDDFVARYKPPKCVRYNELWLRSSAYKRMDGKAPKFLALHEFACPWTALGEETLKCEVQGNRRETFKLLGAQGEVFNE